MSKLKPLKNAYTQEPYLLDTKTGHQYRRTVGAITWPSATADDGERPGCVIVLAESLTLPNVVGAERRDVWRLDEHESYDASELIETAQRFQADWLVRTWATPMQDRRSYMLHDANDVLRKLRQPRMRYGDPIGWMGKGEGLLPFYHALIQRRTLSEKSLHLGSPSGAADEVAALGPKDTMKPVAHFPSAAALMFALAEIDLHKMPEWKDRGGIKGAIADTVGGY